MAIIRRGLGGSLSSSGNYSAGLREGGVARVAIVMPQGRVSGAERMLGELLRGGAPGVVAVLAPSASELARLVADLGYPVVDFWIPRLRDVSFVKYARAYARALRTLNSVLRGGRVDLLHAYLPLTLKVVAPVALIRRVPVVLSVHDVLTAAAIGRIKSAIMRGLANRSADAVIAVSEYVAEMLISAGYNATRISVVHNGVSPRRQVDRDAARSELAVSPSAFVYMLVGRLSSWKGQDLAIAAFEAATAAMRRPSVLVLAGEPFYPEDEAYASNLYDYVSRNGLVNIVFAGQITDVGVAYSAADVILVPSTQCDPFPTTVLEAGLAGRPVIVSDAGGGKEAVKRGITGLVVRPEVGALADAMVSAQRPGWAEKAGLDAAAHVRAAFSSGRYVAETVAVWHRVVWDRRSRSRCGRELDDQTD